MADLTSGRYPNQNPQWANLGMGENATQSDIPMFTNGRLPLSSEVTDGKPILTKEEVVFPVTIPWGTVIKKLTLFNGAEATETVEHFYWCVRSAPALTVGGEFKPVLQAETGDLTTFKGAKVEPVSVELTKPLLITPEIAPQGFVYFGVLIEAGGKAGSWATLETPATALNKAVSSFKVFPLWPNGPIYAKTKPTAGTSPPEKELKEVVYVVKIPLVTVQ